MLAEAIAKLAQMGQDARKVEILRVPEEGPRAYGLLDQRDGTLEVRRGGPPPRAYTAFTLAAFTEILDREHSERPGPVFVGQGRITAFFDDAVRLDSVSMALPCSQEYGRLASLQMDRQKFTQRKFIDLLRIDLAGACPPDFLELIRAIKIDNAESSTSEVRTGRESLTTDIKRAVHARGQELPDGINLAIRVYDLPDEDSPLQEVSCAVNVDLADGSFVLVPLAGSLTRALREVDAYLRQRLVDELRTVPTIVVQGQS